MRLVIEREGGFDVIENSDDIKRIEPQNDGVRVTFTDDTDEFFPVESHAAACQLAAAIAVKCGELVEPLAKGPDEVKASEWVTGEPPRDGRWYVAVIGFVPASLKCPKAVRWSKAQWLDSDGVGWGDTLPLAHLLPPIPDVPVQLTQTGAGGTQ